MIARFKKYFLHQPYQNENLNLRNIIKPLYILLSLFGLFSFNFKLQNNKNGVIIFKRSIFYYSLYACSILLTVCTFLVIHVMYIYLSADDNRMIEELMTQMNYIIELVGLTTFCVVTYLCVFINHCRYLKILKAIATWIDASHANCARILRHLRYQVNVVIGLLLIILLMQACINFTRHDSLWKKTLVTMSFNFPQMIQFTTIAFYCVLIRIVVAILSNIQEQIANLAKEKRNKRECFIKLEQKQVTLREMEMLYVKAFEIMRDVNQTFQAPILVTMIQCFHSMVSEAHIIYHGIVVEGSLNAHEIINCSVWILYQIMKIYAISNSGYLLKDETLKLGQALHNIPTEKQDTRFLLEIQHFTSLMSFQYKEITVYGYFSLDATLMFKVVASAATYLIILVQLDKRND